MNKLLCYIAASTTDLIGPVRYKKIINKWGDIRPYFELSLSEQLRFFNLKGKKAEDALSQMMHKAENALRVCEQKGIDMITVEDEAYPPLLKQIPDPPPMIYMWGQYNYSIPKLGVVGTRRVSPESESINSYFCREISSYQVGIVSGLAQGHDAIAARVTLENDGYTVAVLGTGIDVPYPSSNARLFEEIRQKGAIISEYPPGTSGNPWRFPLRNRIISGLSQAVLVIQAPMRSGALITAKYAEAQGKDLFVVPGNPVDERNAGTNQLIQNGARLALKPEDIVQNIFNRLPARKKSPTTDWRKTPGLEAPEIEMLDLMEHEIYIDELVNKLGLKVPAINILLTQLELKGLVKQYPGRYYIRNV